MTVRPGSLTRQQLYDRIRESSKDEVVLEEMIRLGFWPGDAAQPDLPAALIKRRGEIHREIADLHAEERLWRDPETALKAMHKRRKTEALARRRETRLRHAQGRHDRALAWHARRGSEVLFLGPEVSAGLHSHAARRPLLPGLPDLATPKALADAMGLPLAELRFLAYDRALARISHYQRFTIPKKTGGERLISAPMPRLKRAQYWVLDAILAKVPVHEAAHGFVPGRSILTNAGAHVGRDVVVNLDLENFFPTLTFRRVKGKFRGLGYPESVATVLALLCTEPDVDELELDGERLFAARGPRRLPQGAPTSPMLTNLVCTRLDRRLAALAASLGFTYTRYADDMTFSASGEGAAKVSVLLRGVGTVVAAEGFTLHPDKTRVMRRGRRQEVTGLTVNERVAVPRDTLRRFRALLHQIDRSGPAGKRWGVARHVFDAAFGFACFVRMVSPATGDPLVSEVRRLSARHGTAQRAVPEASAFRARAARGETPLARWWSPAERPPPTPEPILLESPDPAPSTVPQSAIGAAAGAQTADRDGVWGRMPDDLPPGKAGLSRIVSGLLTLAGGLVLFVALLRISPPLALLGALVLAGLYAAGFFRRR
ncbi:DNA polymerase [Methylobacterium variabile]|jgi:RNA-directed DNA polymerase|uniref:RNA-directed DNA polymerase n=1 Tax=Methylobacterium variabile TaxID=298794 RepID=A0A0J6SQN4_9HYPH|nr:reverse transcriptase family protein [Methylobacterium variabile]KMO35683.1 DNA polymerase [Methylobacterium variabile]